jgi:branched-chain amino acid transport system substrate-binding protein
MKLIRCGRSAAFATIALVSRWAPALGIGLALLAARAATGCHVFEELEESEPVLIGATFARSGDLGAFGETMVRGLEVAQGVVNDAGGVRGRPAEIRVLDDETDATIAVNNVRRLLDNGAVGIVGPLSSGQALEVQALTWERKVVTISPTAGAESLADAQPDGDRYFFRTISTMRTGSGAAVALFAFEGPIGGRPCRRMAILHSEDATGEAFRDAIEELFEKQGGCVVSLITFPPGEIVDYSSHVERLVEVAPDCAALVAWPEAGAEIVREANDAIAEDPAWDGFYWLGTTALHGDDFLLAARVEPTRVTPSEAESFYGADVDSTPDTREYRDFRTEYNRRLGIDPPAQDTPGLVANTYDAALLVALALEQAGAGASGPAIRDGLLAVTAVGDDHRAYGPIEYAEAVAAIARGDPIHYEGASSTMVLDETGTASNPTVIWHVRDGAFEDVGGYDEDRIRALIEAPPAPDPACE